jgi:hypothetical protein
MAMQGSQLGGKAETSFLERPAQTLVLPSWMVQPRGLEVRSSMLENSPLQRHLV